MAVFCQLILRKIRDLCTSVSGRGRRPPKKKTSPMESKQLATRYAIFIGGLYLLALGIVLIVRSSLGTTPISSENYVLNLHTPISLGWWTFLTNLLLIGGQFWLLRGRRTRRDTVEILLQLPFSFLFTLFIDLNMALTATLRPDGYLAALGLLLCGCLIQSAGVVLELKPRVAMMSAEAFVKYAAQRYGMEFGRVKVRFDVTLVLIAVVLGLLFSGRIEGVREGTVIAACITGHIVSFLNGKVMTRRTLGRLRSALK